MSKFKELLKKWRELMRKLLASVKSMPKKAFNAVRTFLKSLLKKAIGLFKKNKKEETKEEAPVEKKETIVDKFGKKYVKVVKSVKDKINTTIGKFIDRTRPYVTSFGHLIAFIPTIPVAVWAVLNVSFINSIIATFAVAGIMVSVREIIALLYAEEDGYIDDDLHEKAMRDPEYKEAFEEYMNPETRVEENYSKFYRFMKKFDKFSAYACGAVAGVVGCVSRFVFGIDTKASIGAASLSFAMSNVLFMVLGYIADGIANFRMYKKLASLYNFVINGVQAACDRVDAAAKARLDARAAELKRAKQGKKAHA